MPRLAVIRFSHEGNSFSPVPTGREEFQRCEWVKGEAARDYYRGTRTELGAAVAFLDARPDWEGEFLRCAAAPPGGPVPDMLIGKVINEIVADLKAGIWDGVFISLHGAMIGEARAAPDLGILRAVRSAVSPSCLLAASFDLHANMPWELGGAVDIAVGFKTYPHVDTFETAEKALVLLERAVAGEILPEVTVERTGLVLPSHNMRTASGAMAEIESLARAMEIRNGYYDVTPFGGFAYGDTVHAGASVVVTADRDCETARDASRGLCMEIVRRSGAFIPRMPSAEQAVARALQSGGGKRIALVEPADNPMSGGIGDTPGLFRALVEARPETPCLFAFFCDPDLVHRAAQAGEGAALDVSLGGRLTDIYGPPVAVRLQVLRITDGRFVNSGPMWRGLAVDLGGSVLFQLVDCPAIRLIVTGACVSPNDRAYFQLLGLDIREIPVLLAKAKNHFRAAFGTVFDEIIDVDTPGPATADLRALPFRNVTERMLPPWE